jgi:hypothetical protein
MLLAQRPAVVFLGCLYLAFFATGVGMMMFGSSGHGRFGVFLILNAVIPCVALAGVELFRRRAKPADDARPPAVDLGRK